MLHHDDQCNVAGGAFATHQPGGSLGRLRYCVAATALAVAAVQAELLGEKSRTNLCIARSIQLMPSDLASARALGLSQ